MKRVGPRLFWTLILSFGGLLSGAARPALAQDGQTQSATAESEDRAREAFERGRIHYDNGEFQQAAQAFDEAYQLSGRPGLLYNLYLAHRDANQPKQAAQALRSFLEQVDVIENRAQLEARLAALEAGIAKREAELAAREEAARRARAQAAAAQEQPALVQPGEAPSEASDVTGRWWLTPTIVLASGAALALGSIPTGIASLNASDKLSDSCEEDVCDPKYRDDAERGETLAIVTDVLLFTGIATAVTGAVLMLVKRPRGGAPDRRLAASAGCASGQCGGSLSWRF